MTMLTVLEASGPSGAEVTGDCKLPDVDAMTQTQKLLTTELSPVLSFSMES